MEKCFNGKELNPITCHFVKKCKPGFVRNEQFLCRKSKKLNTNKNKRQNKTKKMNKSNSPKTLKKKIKTKQHKNNNSIKLLHNMLAQNSQNYSPLNSQNYSPLNSSPTEDEVKNKILLEDNINNPNKPLNQYKPLNNVPPPPPYNNAVFSKTSNSYKRVFPTSSLNKESKDKKYIIFEGNGTGIMLADNLYKNKKMIELSSLLKKKGYTNPPVGWYAFEKYDGLRGIWTGKELVARPAKTKTKSEKSNTDSKAILKGKVFNYIPDWFKAAFPPGISLDGELWMGRGKFQKISGLSNLKIGKKVTEEYLNTMWKDVKFMAFDIPSEANIPFTERTIILKNLIQDLKRKYGSDYDFPIEYCDSVQIRDGEHLKQVYKEYVDGGAEGVILREPTSLYETKRSKLLLKMKLNEDAEAKVIEYIPGTGKYVGKLGSIKCKLKNGKEFNIGTGFNDIMRTEYDDPQSEHYIPIGGVVNFSYMELTNGGIPRHPVYRGMRTDVAF